MENETQNQVIQDMKRANIAPKSKKLVWLLAGIGGVLIVVAAILITLALTVWSAPNKQDFEEASRAVKAADESVSVLYKDRRSYLTLLPDTYKKGFTPEQVEIEVAPAKDKYLSARERHGNNLEELDGLKAFKDEDLSRAFKEYKEHQQRYVTYVSEFADAFEISVRAGNYSCKDVSTASRQAKGSGKEYLKSIADANRELSKDCLEDLNKLAKAKNAPFAQYGKDYIEFIESRQKALDDAVAAEGSLSSLVGPLARKLEESGAKFNAAVRVFVKARDEEATKISRAANTKEFRDLIAKKIEEAK